MVEVYEQDEFPKVQSWLKEYVIALPNGPPWVFCPFTLLPAMYGNLRLAVLIPLGKYFHF